MSEDTTSLRIFVKSKLKEIEDSRNVFNAELDRERERYLMTMSVLDDIDTERLRAEVEKDMKKEKRTGTGNTDE